METNTDTADGDPAGPTNQDDGSPMRSVAVAFGLAIVGILGAELFTVPVQVLDPAIVDSPGEVSVELRTAFLVLNFVGMAAIGAAYLHLSGRGFDYVDIRQPTRRDWIFAGIGIGLSLLLYVVAVAVITLIDLPASDNPIVEFVDTEFMILIMILIVFFFNAPAEEFLFRNVIQKRLYDAFSRMESVFIAAGLFALIHLPVYYLLADSVLAVVVPVVIVFFGGAIFGYVYAETDNLFVPILGHAVYNAFIFSLLFLQMRYDLGDDETVTGLVLDCLPVLA